MMQPQAPRDLLKVDPKDKGEYRPFSLVHLTAYSVHWLGNWGIATTYENISVLNGRLFPSDFTMNGFPELPDAFRTNRSLLQMRPKYRNFATSDPRKGVYLTEKGQMEVARVIETIGPPTFEGHPVDVSKLEIDPRRPNSAKARTQNPLHIMHEIRSKILFRRFKRLPKN